MEQKFDWNDVVELDPKGYVELNNGTEARHGPIESIELGDSNEVVIKLKWSLKMPLGESGLPAESAWRAVPENPPIRFPNFTVPYVIEDTPEKGPRVRFGTNILYINDIEGIDPKEVEGLFVKDSK